MDVKGFSVDEMQPWFEWAEKRYKIQEWTDSPNANNSTLEKGCEKLGISWGKISRNVSGCLNLGYCGTGCPVNAKQSTLVTSIPGALKAGAMLISKARAETFDLRKGNIVQLGRVVMDGEGKELQENEDVKEFYLGMGGSGRKSFRDLKNYRRRKRWL